MTTWMNRIEYKILTELMADRLLSRMWSSHISHHTSRCHSTASRRSSHISLRHSIAGAHSQCSHHISRCSSMVSRRSSHISHRHSIAGAHSQCSHHTSRCSSMVSQPSSHTSHSRSTGSRYNRHHTTTRWVIWDMRWDMRTGRTYLVM